MLSVGRCLFVMSAVAAILSSCGIDQSPRTKGSAKANTITRFEPCVITGRVGSNREEAECVVLQRPLDPSNEDADQPTVDVRVARIKSLAPAPAEDAFTVINGGPGGSSSSLYANLAPAFQAILRERDIIVIDQRGTGASTKMDCPGSSEISIESDLSEIESLVQECLNSLPADPRFFTTSIAVADLEAVRKLLRYKQLSIYGVSYGTRVAQHYARQYPRRTRVLVLDGAVPTTTALGPEIATNAQRALDTMIAQCLDSEDCEVAFPELESELRLLQERIRTQPPTVTVSHPITGKPETLTLDKGHLAIVLRFLSYVPETRSILPLIIHEAATKKNYLPLASQALKVSTELNTLAVGMHNSVVCTEDVPFFKPNLKALKAAVTGTFIGAQQLEALVETCEYWPKGSIDDNFKQPFESEIPTLLLSGEFDPITPPENAQSMVPLLANASHVIAPGQGHGVIMRGCIPVLLRDFILTSDISVLDTACVDRLGSDPFFIDLMGPPR